MKANEWSLTRSAFYGAACGVVVAVGREFIAEDGLIPQTAAHWAGLMIGGAIGGMLLFRLAAAILNSLSR